MPPTEFGPDGLPIESLPPVPPEDEQTTANRVGEVLGGTGDVVEGAVDGMELIGDSISGAADTVGSFASGAAEAVGGAADGIGAVAEGVGSAVGAAADGCGSCSLAVFVMLASVGAAVAAVLR
ncbi:MAG: hypothetical protein U0804_27930 [Gemmataceae bacterium]